MIWRWLKYTPLGFPVVPVVWNVVARVLSSKSGKTKNGELEFDQRFVLAGHRQRRRGQRRPVVEQDVAAHLRQPGRERLDQRQEIDIEQQGRGAGVVQSIKELLGRQGEVPRLQHRAHHRDGEVAFVVAVAVPVQHRDHVASLDAEIRQRIGQPPQPVAELPVGVPALAIDNDLLGRAGHRRVQQVLDEQRKLVSRRSDFDQIARHGARPPMCES